jgi:hypothetical protein
MRSADPGRWPAFAGRAGKKSSSSPRRAIGRALVAADGAVVFAVILVVSPPPRLALIEIAAARDTGLFVETAPERASS